MFELKFTPEAEETYDSLVLQLRERWGDKFVTKFEVTVEKSFKTISSTPYRYPILEENTEIRRGVLHKNCSMLYKIYDGVVLVVCFWDNRQEPFLNY